MGKIQDWLRQARGLDYTPNLDSTFALNKPAYGP